MKNMRSTEVMCEDRKCYSLIVSGYYSHSHAFKRVPLTIFEFLELYMYIQLT